MALRDLMPLENVRGLVASMERALEEPWELTSARLLGSEWLPKLDVKETPRDVVVTAYVPGLAKDDLHVSATEDMLSIRGVTREEERSRSFYRSLALPATIRPDEVKAHFRDGRLTVTLPKARHSQVRRIPIQ